MGENELSFDHIHIISEDPRVTATWYVDKLDATINGEYELRGAPQINVSLGGATLLVRGRRPGEDPSMPGRCAISRIIRAIMNTAQIILVLRTVATCGRIARCCAIGE